MRIFLIKYERLAKFFYGCIVNDGVERDVIEQAHLLDIIEPCCPARLYPAHSAVINAQALRRLRLCSEPGGDPARAQGLNIVVLSGHIKSIMRKNPFVNIKLENFS